MVEQAARDGGEAGNVRGVRPAHSLPEGGLGGRLGGRAPPKYFDKMPNQSKGVSLNTYINQLISRIAANNNNSKAGCWDIILWANSAVVFVEMKCCSSNAEIGETSGCMAQCRG